MKSRWIIGVLILSAVGALVAYIAQNSHWEDITIPAPLRGEAVTNPFYASQKLAEKLGATTEWRRMLGDLQSVDVIVLSHWHWDLIQDRRRQLEEWVDDGGRVVVDRTLIGGEDHLETWAGIRRAYAYDDDEDEEEDEEAEEEENADEPQSDEVTQAGELCNTSLRPVDARGEIIADGRELSICKLDAFSHLTTERDVAWGLASHRGIHALRVKVGRGSVTSINADPFGNRDLLEVDHGRLFVAATQLRHGDRVVFVSEREHASLLSLIWTHGAPVVVLSLIALGALLWRGGMRFGPLAAPTDLARRSIAEQIRGTGQFTIRLGGGKALHAAAVRALQEAAGRRIARYESLSHAERIAAIASASGVDAEMLAQAINHGAVRRPSELAHTIALLETARRNVLNNRSTPNSQPGA